MTVRCASLDRAFDCFRNWMCPVWSLSNVPAQRICVFICLCVYGIIYIIRGVVCGMVRKVLIVDDEKGVLITMKNILENRGYEVSTSFDEEIALGMARKIKFDLIILDIMMPVSGYDVLKAMKTEAIGAPKIMFVSIVPVAEVNLEHVDGFIQKPFDIMEFMREVDKVMWVS